MPQYLAFLRGINLGRRRIRMDELRAHFEAMKLTHVETFIASGNVIFESKERDRLKLARAIEQHLEKTLGYAADTFVRTRAEIATAAAFKPFSPVDLDPPENTVHIGFFNQAPTAAQARGLLSCRTEVDEFCVEGREFFWLCRRIKTHESKVWSSPTLRALKLPSSSMRNLTTLRKLAALYPPR